MERCKVKVTKSDREEQDKLVRTSWYTDWTIGKVFEVEECVNEANKHMVRVLGTNHYILKDHCTPVDDEGEELNVRPFYGMSEEKRKKVSEILSTSDDSVKKDEDGMILSINGRVAHYFSNEGIVRYSITYGRKDDFVDITCNVPKNWEIKRVCQFMESLLKAGLV